MVKSAAATPPKLTEAAPLKLDPLITTVCPVPAETGEKEEIVGG
jgi:hypothetical protein